MGSKVHLEPRFCVIAAAAILLIPLEWLGAWTVAVCVHELCHVVMLMLMGVPVRQIVIGADGTKICTQSMSPSKELLCALAGPAGSFSLLLLARWMPLVAICGFVQGCYNLLPLNSMDGGRIVSCLLRLFCGQSVAGKVEGIIEWCAVAVLFLLSLYCLLCLHLGLLPLIFVLFLAVRSGKIPCKTCCKRVQ